MKMESLTKLVEFFFHDDASLNDMQVPVEVKVFESCNVEVRIRAYTILCII